MKPIVLLIHAVLGFYILSAHGTESIKTSQDAIRYVLSSSELGVSNAARLVTLYERKDNGLSWTITIRDGDSVHRIKVTEGKSLELENTEVDSELNNVEFWAAQPAPLELPIASHYVTKAKQVLESFNSTFSANTQRYQSILTVCKPPKAGRKSRHPTGCASPYFTNQTWNVRMVVDLPEDKWKVREVVFDHDQAESIRGVMVQGRWQF